MNKVSLSPEAERDLKEIRRYIEEELCDPGAAGHTLKAITKRLRELQTYPEIGVSLSAMIGIPTDYRMLVCGSYLAFYRVEPNEILVVRILYGRRDYLKVLFGHITEE